CTLTCHNAKRRKNAYYPPAIRPLPGHQCGRLTAAYQLQCSGAREPVYHPESGGRRQAVRGVWTLGRRRRRGRCGVRRRGTVGSHEPWRCLIPPAERFGWCRTSTAVEQTFPRTTQGSVEPHPSRQRLVETLHQI